MGTRLYPNTTNPSVICTLTGVDIKFWTIKQDLEKEIAARTSQGLYVPRPEEITRGKALDSWKGQQFWQIFVKMPDGKIIPGDTGYQGEQEDDCSYLVHKWLQDFHPEVANLQHFKLFGWGRVILPCYMEDSCCGGTDDLNKIKDILDEMDIQLPPGVKIADLEGVHWS